MGKSYFYFAASLPYINFDSKPPMTTEEFIKECERLLPEEESCFIAKMLSTHVYDRDFLINLISGHQGEIKSHNEAFQKGMAFTLNFRNEITAYRAERANKDPNDYIRGERYSDPFLVEIIQQAANAPTLLEGERILDRARWQFLDELATGHFFDIEYINVYGLKLRILERYAMIKSEAGPKRFEDIKRIKFERAQNSAPEKELQKS